jgi:hypothetical protein
MKRSAAGNEEHRWQRVLEPLEELDTPSERLRAALRIAGRRKDCDGDLAASLVDSAWDSRAGVRHARRLEDLFELLCSRRPRAWEQERGHLTGLRVANLLRIPASDPVTALEPLLLHPADDLDEFLRIADMLRYHGRTGGLAEAMVLGLAPVTNAGELPGGLLREYLETMTALLHRDRPEVRDKCEKLMRLTAGGRSGVEPGPLMEFAERLETERGWPHSRALMASLELHECLPDPRSTPRGLKNKPAPDAKKVADRISGLLDVNFHWRPHRAGALALGLGPWLEHLFARRRPRPGTKKKALDEAAAICSELSEELEDFYEDPILSGDLERAASGRTPPEVRDGAENGH